MKPYLQQLRRIGTVTLFHTHLYRVSYLSVLFLFVISVLLSTFRSSFAAADCQSGSATATQGSSTASCLPSSELQALTEYPNWVGTSGQCSDTTGDTTTTSSTSGGSTGPIWSSGVPAPYYLESFVINVLEDIATKLNVPESDAVTQQHVLALVAWAYAEGGNITNTDAFNPWNTGLDDPALIAGSGSSSGVQSFKSFDDGVEANAIVMTAPNQNRIGDVLTKPGSSASDVMHAIAYYTDFPGDELWAATPIPLYYASLMANLSQAESNYDTEASVEIGPGEEDTTHVPTTDLQFSGAAGSSSGGSSGDTSGGGSCCSTATGTSGTTESGGGSGQLGANAQPAFTYLTTTLGFSPLEADAMLGNLQQESGINPTEPGGGLAQWLGGRWTAMEAYVTGEGKDPNSLDGQLDFVKYELQTDKSAAYTALQTDTSLTQATTDFMTLYKGPEAALANLSGRIQYAQDAATQFGSASSGGTTSSGGSGCTADD
jgi:hypothetical protein